MVDAILEAAARILEDDGLGQFNTNAIAARAGVSVGSLYQYFPSREAILAELIRIDHADLLSQLTRTAEGVSGGPLAEAVRGLVDVGVAHQLKRPGLARALDYAEPLLPLAQENAGIEARIQSVVVAMLRGHVPRLRGQALQTAAADVAALARGMIDAAGLRGETGGRALAERVTRTILGYLAPYVV